MAHEPVTIANSLSELHKLQFDYAWKWFSFHADQRIKVFNYMLLVFGIFAAGIVNALDKHLPSLVTGALCFIAGFLALIFTRLDSRNRQLVWLGEDVLVGLEREVIFAPNKKISGRYNKEVTLGILWRQMLEERKTSAERAAKKGTFGNNQLGKLYDACRGNLRDAWRGKHRILLPWIGYLIAILFFVAGILILRYTPKIQEILL